MEACDLELADETVPLRGPSYCHSEQQQPWVQTVNYDYAAQQFETRSGRSVVQLLLLLGTVSLSLAVASVRSPWAKFGPVRLDLIQLSRAGVWPSHILGLIVWAIVVQVGFLWTPRVS